MTEIEQLVRQALAETPMSTTTTDPLAALDRRVRKARRWLAAGAGAVAAGVVAAIVVPLLVLSGGNDAANNKVIVGNTPTPSASNPPGVTTWWPSGAVDVTAGMDQGAPSWVLVHDTGKTFISPIDPNMQVERYTVPDPADYVAAGHSMEWVVGTDSATNTVRVSVLSNAGGEVHSMTLSGSVVGAPAVVADSLYVLTADATSTFVRHFVLSNDGIDQSQPLVLDGTTEIATTSKGHVWVQGRQKLYEVVTTGNAVKEGSAVDWSGGIYGPGGVDSTGDTMWAYDGRLIDLQPKNLLGCVSCAEGWRINVAGVPTAVATASDGGLFVAVPHSGLFYYPAADVHGAGTISGQPLAVDASSLVADGAGGVDYIDDQGRLQHWDPQLGAGTR